MDFLHLFDLNYSIEYVIIQLAMLILLFLIVNNTNLYYNLLYLLLLIFFFGLILCMCNNELTAGFLWVTEIIVVFVLLLLLFYVNIYGDSKKIILKYNYFMFLLILFFCLVLPYDISYDEEELMILYSDIYWVDYYEALNNDQMNDFFGFFMSYYTLNSIILIVLGLILFFGSIVCVLLFRLIKVVKFNNVNNFFETLRFSQSFLYSIFMRKQDLFEQNSFIATLKAIYSKKDD